MTLQVSTANSRLVSSEGTVIATPSASARMVMEAQTRADDGMELLRVETFQAPSASGLPSEAELTAKDRQDGGGLARSAQGARSQSHMTARRC